MKRKRLAGSVPEHVGAAVPTPESPPGADRRLHGERLAALVQAQRVLAVGDATVDQQIDRIPDLALSVIPASGALFELLDGDSIIVRSGSAAVDVGMGLRFPLEGSLTGEALRLDCTLRCNDSESDPRAALETCRRFGLRSVLATVVRDRSGPIGVLKVFDFSSGRFDAADADSLELLAEALGAVIQRERAEKESRRAARMQAGILAMQLEMTAVHDDSQALLELGVERARSLTGAEGAAIAFVDGADLINRATSGSANERIGLRIPRAGSLVGRAMDDNQVLRCDDSELDPRVQREYFRRFGLRSAVVAPLRIGGVAVGAIRVMSSKTHAFASTDVSTLQILAECLSAAIQRADATARLLRSEAQYRLLFAAHPLPMWVWDAETLRYLAVNDSAIAQYGYSKDEFLAMTVHDIGPPAAIREPDAQPALLGDGPQRTGIREHRRKDGTSLEVELNVTSLEFGGRPARFAMVNDVTERKRTERELKKSASLLDMATRIARVGGWTIELPSRRFTWSDELCALYGVAKGGLATIEEAFAFFTPHSRALLEEAAALGRSEGASYDLELEADTADGRHIWVRAIGQIMRDAKGAIVGGQGAVQDITEKKRADETLRAVAARLTSTLESITDAFYTLDHDWRFTYVNSKTERLMQLSRAQMLGKTVWDLFPGATGTDIDRQFRLAVSTNQAVGFESFYPPWNQWFEVRAYPSETGLTVYFHDTTERRRAQEELRTLNETLEAKVAERTADLEQALLGAEAASRAKSAFVATMSHEIRTPMNGVIGMLDVLYQSPLAADQSRMLGVARDSAHALLSIIEDILDFSKIEAGRVELERLPMSVASVTTKVCELIAGMARGKAVALVVEADRSLPQSVWGDAGRLRQVLVNLLSNAIKFSSGRSGALVSVRASATASEAGAVDVRLEVGDNGVGMDADTVDRLFVPFSQADASTTRRFGGTGLGLAISHHLVELMGGTIEVRSTPGAGSVFTVCLPCVIAPGAPVAASASASASAATDVAPGPGRTGDPAAPSGPQLVLVAEDNEINQQVITLQLERLGYRCEVVADGREALARWQSGRFGIVLTDLQMPEMDGYELATSIRAGGGKGGDRDVPIIALTANALKEEAVRCRASGMNECLTKPVPMAMLDATLKRWLRNERADGRPAFPAGAAILTDA